MGRFQILPDDKKWIIPVGIALISLLWAPIVGEYVKDTFFSEPVIIREIDFEDQVKVNSLVYEINALNSLYTSQYANNSSDYINKTKICAELAALISEEAGIMKKYNPNYVPRDSACTGGSYAGASGGSQAAGGGTSPSGLTSGYPLIYPILGTISLLGLIFLIMREK